MILSSPSKGLDIHLGVSITEGQGKFFLTKVITFMPRFILTNMMDQELICRQYGGAATVVVAGNTSSPLHYLGPGAQQQLCFRLGGLLNDWLVLLQSIVYFG